MHEQYDSIRRNVYDVIPVVPSYDENLTIVMFPFTEKRYREDGEIENIDSSKDIISKMVKLVE